MKFKLSTFNNVGDTRPQPIERTWEELCAKFRNPQIREEKDGLLFSPAIYRGNRRLQRDVIELSLLVLEVDGAWKCEGNGLLGACNYRAPLIIFRNRKRAEDKCPQCKKEVTISQIHFELPTLITDVRQAVQSAFAIYSTHSHKRVTDSAPVAEPRFRIVVPLSEPIPVERFKELWQWAANSLKAIPADPQDKDPNRIYYTPVKCSQAAAYEFHIEAGALLNWRRVLEGSDPSAHHQVGKGTAVEHSQVGDRGRRGGGEGVLGNTAATPSHEDRNEELARRIMARGKLNSQGNWDAKCLAHGGKGNSALCYFPHTGAVKCNRGCDYLGPGGILDAEGLSYDPLPSRDRLSALRTASVPDGDFKNYWTGTTAAKLHAIYGLMLAHFFVLTAKDETAIRRDWELNPYGNELIEYPESELSNTKANRGNRVAEIKHCSMPSLIEQATACRDLIRLGFDLRGVPGFYLIEPRAVPGEPTRASQVDQWRGDEFGPWRLYLPYRKGLLVGYTNGTGYLLGIKIYRSTKDPNPVLLTSRGLPGGTKAVAVKESVAA